tara:strand:+ start:3682 stop:4005 length:324 start_codon:yes stop_codon:yes gene_type:complete
MQLNETVLKDLVREALNEVESQTGASVAGLGGTAKTAVKNPQVQKFIEKVKERLGKVSRKIQIEFLSGLIQELGIDPALLTTVKTDIQKQQKDAAQSAQQTQQGAQE